MSVSSRTNESHSTSSFHRYHLEIQFLREQKCLVQCTQMMKLEEHSCVKKCFIPSCATLPKESLKCFLICHGHQSKSQLHHGRMSMDLVEIKLQIENFIATSQKCCPFDHNLSAELKNKIFSLQILTHLETDSTVILR